MIGRAPGWRAQDGPATDHRSADATDLARELDHAPERDHPPGLEGDTAALAGLRWHPGGYTVRERPARRRGRLRWVLRRGVAALPFA